MRLRPLALVGPSLLVAALAAASCSAQGKGSLVLAVSTDMQTPKDLDVVSVFVSTNGTPKFDYLGRVQPDGTLTLPSTLAIVEPDDSSAQVRIRVVGFKTTGSGDAKVRVVRDVLTTVPHQRTSLLRMPLNFLDDGSGSGTLSAQFVPGGGAPEGDTAFDPTDPRAVTTVCDFTQAKTSIAGTCQDASVDSSRLADYSDSSVYGNGGSATQVACFAVDRCLSMASQIAPSTITTASDGSCSFPLPATENAQNWNCALATTDGTGTCTGGRCYVPLESDPGEGFSVQPGKAVVMVPGVCKKLAAGATLYVDTSSCPTKVEASPVCQPGQGQTGGPDGGKPDGGVGPMDSSTGSDGAACTAADGGKLGTATSTGVTLPQCGGIALFGAQSCGVTTGAACSGQCTASALNQACSAELEASCALSCTTTPAPSCTSACQSKCTASCTNPATFGCDAFCEGDCASNCSSACTQQCAMGAAACAQCTASCQQSCGSRCDGQCSALPGSSSCALQCQAACTGDCTAQANLACDIDCQTTGFATCRTQDLGACQTACQSANGAIYCNGQWVNASDVTLCSMQISASGVPVGTCP
jgi:hypothetical protein